MAVDFLALDTEIARMQHAESRAAAGRHAISAYGEIRLLRKEDLTDEDKAGLQDRVKIVLTELGIDPDAETPAPSPSEEENLRRHLVMAVSVARNRGLNDATIRSIMEEALNGT